ncbi:hypothetical protein RFI_10694, partial [Reticulomyxa filosa]
EFGRVVAMSLYQHHNTHEVRVKTLNEYLAEWNERKQNWKEQTPQNLMQVLSGKKDVSSALLATGGHTGAFEQALPTNLSDNRNPFVDPEATRLKEMLRDEENKEIGKEKEKEIGKEEEKEEKANGNVFILLVRKYGRLEMYAMEDNKEQSQQWLTPPSPKLVFCCNELNIGHQVLKNALIHDESVHIIMSKHLLAKRKTFKRFLEEEARTKERLKEEYYVDELIPQNVKDEMWCETVAWSAQMAENSVRAEHRH